jgi:hypothetical protein
MVDTPPNKDPIKAASEKPWSPQGHIPNRTFSRAAFKTYNTFVVPVLLISGLNFVESHKVV